MFSVRYLGAEGDLSEHTWVLAVDHLAQIEGRLGLARERMVDRLRGLIARLPADDPDRVVLQGCGEDLATSGGHPS